MNKQKVTLLAVAAICLSILSGLTLAYFTAEDTAHNVITTGQVAIKIEEWQETDNGLVPYPKDKPQEAMPSDVISKVAKIKNLDADVWIRAKAKITVKDSEGKLMEVPEEKLKSIIVLIGSDSKWVRKTGDSEWLYYNASVPAGQSTEPLFKSLRFDGPGMTNEFQDCTVEVTVDAQAVQTANNGSSVVEAAGWPES
jgi:predicted ribosomally synthesized peptide with SipW-like signal peptide